MSRPFPSRTSPAGPQVRINGKIRAREVRVIGPDGGQLGILALHEAINLARSRQMDLVEVAPTATPPVCRVIDYGRYLYEQAKRQKESKKHQHANRVKEIQLTASIDAHDFGVKVGHAVDFLCEEMKVKVSLRFRGREMAHQEFGRQVMDRFIKELGPYGHAVEPPRLIGRGLNAMLTPLPRNKRARNPREVEGAEVAAGLEKQPLRQVPTELSASPGPATGERPVSSGGFGNTPFAGIEARLQEPPS